MWAGSRIHFVAPIPVGSPIERRSTIEDIRAKSGRQGEMLFVTLSHQVLCNGAVAVEEEQDLVYRGAAAPSPAGKPAPAEKAATAHTTETMTADPVRLFRYSALTFNAHRIHYDRDYARAVEGYPGLVVHGPYLATLLIDFLLRQQPGARVTRFEFRARRPLFDGVPFSLCMGAPGPTTALWTVDAAGAMTMTATAEVASAPSL
jgi:3-methylfumaryl-CoA hydratase